MATVEIDFAALCALLMPGLNAKIDGCMVDHPFERVFLEVSGPDVPQCERALIVMMQHVDDHDAIVRTATLKPVD